MHLQCSLPQARRAARLRSARTDRFICSSCPLFDVGCSAAHRVRACGLIAADGLVTAAHHFAAWRFILNCSYSRLTWHLPPSYTMAIRASRVIVRCPFYKRRRGLPRFRRNSRNKDRKVLNIFATIDIRCCVPVGEIEDVVRDIVPPHRVPAWIQRKATAEFVDDVVVPANDPIGWHRNLARRSRSMLYTLNSAFRRVTCGRSRNLPAHRRTF
jgi:hypothetical protein